MNDDINKKIADDFGLSHMDQAEQERLVERIGTLLFQSVVERAVHAMDQEVMREFGNTLDTAGEDYSKVLSFMKNKVPNFPEIVSEELSRLKRTTSSIFA